MSGMTTPSYNQDVLRDTLNLTLEFLSDIITNTQSISEFAHQHEFFRNNKVSEITRHVSQFVEVTTLISKMLKTRKNVVIPGIKNSHIHLLFVIKAMNQAQLKQDFIALEELIKYELKDNLTQWKIDLIPQIKKQLNT